MSMREQHKAGALEMMLKAMGIDIEEIKNEIFETIRQILGGIKELVDTQKRVERKLDALLTELKIPYHEMEPRASPQLEHLENKAA